MRFDTVVQVRSLKGLPARLWVSADGKGIAEGGRGERDLALGLAQFSTCTL